MAHKRSKAPAAGNRGALGFVSCSAACDIRLNTASGRGLQAPPTREAQQVVNDLVANGAVLKTYPRPDGLLNFSYELAKGGDRGRCRAIIQSAKAHPALWMAILHDIDARTKAVA